MCPSFLDVILIQSSASIISLPLSTIVYSIQYNVKDGYGF